jgi:hypothetical protein
MLLLVECVFTPDDLTKLLAERVAAVSFREELLTDMRAIEIKNFFYLWCGIFR